MKRDVMLPKFNLPGQTSWLIKGLWIAGGVVLLQVGIVSALLLRDRGGERQAAVAVPAAQASPAPAVPRPAPAPAETSPPPRAADGTGSPASDPPKVNRPGRMGKAGVGRFAGKGKLRRNGGNRLFTRNALPAGKLAAVKGGRRPGLRNAGNAPRPGKGGKQDEIDRLLRNFK